MFRDFFRQRETIAQLRLELNHGHGIITELQEQLRACQNNESDRPKIPLKIDQALDEGGPTDPKRRREYVANISNFFEETMQQKLLAVVGEVREELAQLDQTGTIRVPKEQYDWFLRGTENAIWLIHDWFVQKSGEHRENLQGNTKE